MNEPRSSGPTATPATTSPNPQPQLVPIALLVAVVVAVAGGLGSGVLISRYGMIGGIALWGAGVLGGYLARRIMQTSFPPVAWSLVVACILAFALAEISWYRWSITLPGENEVRREPTWAESVARAPNYLLQNAQLGLIVAALFAGFGAHSAYSQAGKRYRLVAVAED